MALAMPASFSDVFLPDPLLSRLPPGACIARQSNSDSDKKMTVLEIYVLYFRKLLANFASGGIMMMAHGFFTGTMRTIFIFLFIFIFSLYSPAAANEKFYKSHLDHRDGLGSNYIRNISQDAHGHIWVVTGSGLSRFDGKGFITYDAENSGLGSNELNCVVADPSNPDKVWIGSRHDGLYIYDYNSGEISKFDGELYTPDVPSLSASSDNKIWVTHYHKPPEKLDPATGKTERLFKSRPDDFPLPIWCLQEDPKRQYLYVGHENGGFTSVNLKTLKFTNYRHIPGDESSICGNTVYSIFIDQHDMVWIGTENGVSVFDPETREFMSFIHDSSPASILPGAVRSIRLMKNGEIWIATSRGGISIVEEGRHRNKNISFRNLTPGMSGNINEKLYSSSPYIIFEDSFGNKWIGYQSDGIDVVGYDIPIIRQVSMFGQYDLDTPHPAVWSMTKDNDGNVWIAGEREIAKLGSVLSSRYLIPGKSYDHNTPVRTLYADDKDRLWMGTHNSGAYVLDTKSGSLKKVNSIDREVRCFIEGTAGDILAGTHNGVYRINGQLEACAENSINDALQDRYVTCMLNDSHGNLLIGTFGQGLTILDGSCKNIATLNTGKGLPSNTINSIFEDSRGHIWIATRGGVARISSDMYTDVKRFDLAAGGSSINIKSIEEDASGKIWMSSENGISCLDPESGSVNTYTRCHRSSLNSFLEGSSCTSDDGTVFFGSLNGLAFFNPSNISGFEFSKGDISVNSLLAHDADSNENGLEIAIPVNSDMVTLPHNLNTFTLRFHHHDFSKAINTEVRYNMKGVNDVWSEAGGDNEAVYRNLEPGTYQFRISTRTFGGEWSEPETLLTIRIDPPGYLTWWAKLLYAVATAAIILSVIYFYKYKLNLEKDLTIEKENSKNNLLLNEERLVFYTNVTHELRTPLSLIIGPIEDLINDPELRDKHRAKLQVIRGSSMRLLNLINSILEFRKTETRHRRLEVVTGNLANFVREIGLRFKELNGNKNVSVLIDVSEMEDTEMYYDPEMITTILNNLMGNALKYTRKGSITLSLKPEKIDGVDYVDLSVADTGEGIAKEELPHIFKRYYQASHNKKIAGTGIGLALTKSLVELHEATISVDSEKGKGSVFTVRFVRDNSYPSAFHKEVAEENTTEHDVAENETPAEGERLKILVVEDDEDVRDYIASSFTDQYDVECANDGKEGLAKVHSFFPDIVISDIMMPEMDGIELCNAIKSDMTTSHIPVILLTAKDSMLDKEEGYNSGADSYMTKPFSARLLMARINNILDTRHRLSLKLLSQPSDKEEITPPNSQNSIDNQHVDSPETTLSPLDREFISKLRRLIEDNIELEEMDMPFLTDKMCMSHSTLYRKVKSVTGLTPNEFIRKIKLTKAVELMSGGEIPLCDIPFRTGFNSMAYFRRVFKKEFGVSPSEYIQQK